MFYQKINNTNTSEVAEAILKTMLEEVLLFFHDHSGTINRDPSYSGNENQGNPTLSISEVDYKKSIDFLDEAFMDLIEECSEKCEEVIMFDFCMKVVCGSNLRLFNSFVKYFENRNEYEPIIGRIDNTFPEQLYSFENRDFHKKNSTNDDFMGDTIAA